MFPGRAWHPNAYPHVPFELNRNSPQAQGLVAWWPPLGSAGANMLRDFGGRGLNGTFKGPGEPAWVVRDAQLGLALYFDGTDDYVSITDDPLLDLLANSDLTFITWVKTTQSYTINELVIGDKRKKGVDGNWKGYVVAQASGNVARAGLFLGSGATSITVSSIKVINDGIVHPVTAVYDRDNMLSIFVDGKSEASASIGAYAGTNLDHSNDLYLGQKSEPASGFLNWNGQIGDTRIYNRALSAAEVWQQYANPWDLYRPLVRRVWHVPVAIAGWPRISPQLATVIPQGPRVGGIYVD